MMHIALRYYVSSHANAFIALGDRYSCYFAQLCRVSLLAKFVDTLTIFVACRQTSIAVVLMVSLSTTPWEVQQCWAVSRATTLMRSRGFLKIVR